jgi:predicted transcriptional regulator
VLVEKGLVSHHYEGPRYVYKTTVSRQAAKKAAVKRLLDTLFEGSREQLLATLLYLEDDEASSKELKRLARLIEKARAHAR